jgi:hypothetical protein
MTERREPHDRIDAIRRRDPDTLERVARENLQPLLRAAREEAVDEIDAVVDARFGEAGQWVRRPRSARSPTRTLTVTAPDPDRPFEALPWRRS